MHGNTCTANNECVSGVCNSGSCCTAGAAKDKKCAVCLADPTNKYDTIMAKLAASAPVNVMTKSATCLGEVPSSSQGTGKGKPAVPATTTAAPAGATKYQYGEGNSLVCPSGTARVLDSAGCRAVAAQEGKTVRTYTDTTYPSGCWKYNGGTTAAPTFLIYHNTAANGRAHAEAQVACAGKGKENGKANSDDGTGSSKQQQSTAAAETSTTKAPSGGGGGRRDRRVAHVNAAGEKTTNDAESGDVVCGACSKDPKDRYTQVKINFQPSDSPPVRDYIPDHGAIFNNRQCHGWKEDTSASALRVNPHRSSPRVDDTFIMPDRFRGTTSASWCIRVQPKRLYKVTVGFLGFWEYPQFKKRGRSYKFALNGKQVDAGAIKHMRSAKVEELVGVGDDGVVSIVGSFPQLSTIAYVEINVVANKVDIKKLQTVEAATNDNAGGTAVATTRYSTEGVTKEFKDQLLGLPGRAELFPTSGMCVGCATERETNSLANGYFGQCVATGTQYDSLYECGAGEYYKREDNGCVFCPSGSYAGDVAFRLQCQPCIEPSMTSPVGSEFKQDCLYKYEVLMSTEEAEAKEIYGLEHGNAKICKGQSQAENRDAINRRGRGLVSIETPEECKLAAEQVLKLPFQEAPPCKDVMSGCAAYLSKGGTFDPCQDTDVTYYKEMEEAVVFKTVCKASCGLCDPDNKQAPRYCVKETESNGAEVVRYYEKEDQQLYTGEQNDASPQRPDRDLLWNVM